MLAVPSNKPEVVVTVNNIRSGCEKRDGIFTDTACSFVFDDGATPRVGYAEVDSSIDMDVAEGDIINFEIFLDMANYQVDYDNSQVTFVPVDGFPLNTDGVSSFYCELDSREEVPGFFDGFNGTCTVGKLPAGEYKLMFTHSETGNGISDAVFYAGYEVVTTDREGGSIYGGQEVFVSGYGFRPYNTKLKYSTTNVIAS